MMDNGFKEQVSLAELFRQGRLAPVRTTDSGTQETLPITGLNSIAGDLDSQEAAIRARNAERRELDAKLKELEEMIKQARQEVEMTEANPSRKPIK